MVGGRSSGTGGNISGRGGGSGSGCGSGGGSDTISSGSNIRSGSGEKGGVSGWREVGASTSGSGVAKRVQVRYDAFMPDQSLWYREKSCTIMEGAVLPRV